MEDLMIECCTVSLLSQANEAAEQQMAKFAAGAHSEVCTLVVDVACFL